MLVLQRKVTERIRIGDDVVVTLVRIGNGHARIGVEAPKDVPILRDELIQHDRATDENGHRKTA